MRDWTGLLSKVKKMSYEEIVEKGKVIVDKVLDSVAKYTDTDSATIMLVGLAAYTASVDNDVSETELKLMQDVVGIKQKDFLGFVKQVKENEKIIADLRAVCLDMTSEELDDFALMLCMIFAVDGEISQNEIDFLKDLCG
ncbi:MAG: hypothetical protein ACI4GC_06290 [Acutalibacteraceae bacterium]